MRTDDLIAALAADDSPVRPIWPRLASHVGAALLVSVALALAVLGPRGDVLAAMTDPVTALKWLMPLLLALAGLAGMRRLTSPLAARLPEGWLLGGVALAAALMLATGWINTPPDLRWATMRGHSLFVCLSSITAISLPALLAAIHVLRDGASLRPALSGALAGLGIGGLAAAGYALHCDEDAPLFFLTWYGTAILIVSLLGALIGRWRLRW